MLMRAARTRHGLLLAALMLPAAALAAGESKPLWEAGVGVAALSFPYYRGSEQRQNFLMPVPYFTYHGDFLKADRHGLRGNLFDSERIDLTLSFSASPPTKSHDVAARNGMPDLKPTAEFGPQVDVTLWRSENHARFLKLRLPLRAAFTLENTPRHAGWIFSPNLNLDITDLPGLAGWNFGLVSGPFFADRKQHAFFYDIAPQQATVARPVYASGGGYSGTQFLAALSRRYEKVWIGAFARYDSLHGVVFDDSPLVKQKHFASAGLAVSWILGESTRRVWIDE
jgi:outer membrane scaffolding protein for murein synthesis (MipA/OmpV family)